jgi:hypothetical protein
MKRKPKNRGGRPYRLSDPETALRFGVAIARNRTIAQAAAIAGVGTSSAYRWLARGRAGDVRFAGLVKLVEAQANPWEFLFGRYSPKTVLRAVDTGMKE